MTDPRSHIRVDGPAKVTGTAQYASDFNLPSLAYAALAKACDQIRDRLGRAAVTTGRLAHVDPSTLRLNDGQLMAPDGRTLPVPDAFARLGTTQIETLAEAVQEGAGPDAIEKLRQGKLVLSSQEKTVRWAYGAQFAEVRVHQLTGEIRATRLVGAFSAGYIIDRLTALDQLRGGMIWGIGSALLEATKVDMRLCRYVNDNLAEYHVATAADTAEINAILLDADGDPDPEKLMGLGELGIIGVNAAIANAFYKATGKRVRDLPIRVNDAL